MALLSVDTLTGTRIGISASNSDDLDRLGLLEGHFNLALGELARMTLLLGGRLQYCGHLRPDGITAFLMGELKRYSRGNSPLDVVLAWPVHRATSLAELRRADEDLGANGTLLCLDLLGRPADPAVGRGEAAEQVPPRDVPAGLTEMRRFANARAPARLLVGGRRSGYSGSIPGILEEAILALEGSKALFLAGGFGGVTHDIVATIAPDAAAWFPSADAATDRGEREGLEIVTSLAAARGWAALENGLDASENHRLAATHRPSEIAALVGLGLGRLASAGLLRP